MSRKKLWFIHIFSLLFTILTITSCASLPESGTGTVYESYSASSDYTCEVQESFHTLTQEIFEQTVTQDTLTLHYTLDNPKDYGINNYPVTLGEYADSTEASAQATILKDYRKRLSECDYDALDSDNQLTYRILDSYLETAEELSNYPLYQNNLTTIIGIQTQLPILLAEYSLESESDVEEYLLLLQDVPNYFDWLLDLEKQKSEAGLFMSDTVAKDVIAECRSFIQNPKENYLLSSFTERLDGISGISETQKSQYIQSNEDAVLNTLIPAYESLIDGLTSLLGTGTNEGGLCNLPEGKAYYELLVQAATGSGKTVPELEERVVTQLKTELSCANNLLQEDATLSSQLADFSFSLTDPEAILSDLQTKISTDFPALPSDVSYTIKYVPEALESSMSPAFYLSPQIDNPTEHTIYINRSSLQTNASSLYATLAHEGFPGHLYQTVYTLSQDTDPIRQICSWKGYTEGWATYVEYYSYSLDSAVNSNLASLCVNNSSATLAIYALLDMYIHYDGWSLSQVQDFLTSYYNISDIETVSEIYYAIVARPTNYLEYYIGYLEILDLKTTAQETMLERFNLKDFHTFLLDIGEAPFPIIEEYMEQWMTQQ
jgi:uncharacterized protein (DUF885 family)